MRKFAILGLLFFNLQAQNLEICEIKFDHSNENFQVQTLCIYRNVVALIYNKAKSPKKGDLKDFLKW